MKAVDDLGLEVDAIFSVEPTPDGAYIILESRGGGEGGPRPPRNADYARGLELLLSRLGRYGASLVDIEVYSRNTQGWPIQDRRIQLPGFPLPLALASITNLQGFRYQLGSASAALGRAPEKTSGGNPTKRLRLTVRWPMAVGKSARALEDLLAGVQRSKPQELNGERSVYAPLGDHLRSTHESEVRLRLSEIERLIGRPLPTDAWTPQFWANTAHHLSRRGQWLEAGFKARFEVRSETVIFTRRSGTSEIFEREQPTSDPDELRQRVKAARLRRKASTESSSKPPEGQSEVGSTVAAVRRYLRDPEVIGWVLSEAAGLCEVCGEKAPFEDSDGEPFLEVHHVRPLSEGGPDQVDNAVATCPNCHRRMHYGADREAIRGETILKVLRLNDYPQKVMKSLAADVGSA